MRKTRRHVRPAALFALLFAKSRMELGHLNEAQRRVVLHGDAPLLVLAAAGTGKTEALTTRIAHLIRERGVHPSAIMAVTFTNKAANEMRRRACALAGLDDEQADMLQIRTFHGMCWRILRSHPAFREFCIVDHADSLKIVATCCKQEGVPAGVKPEVIFNQLNDWRNDALGPEDLPADQPPGSVAAMARRVYVAYRQACARSRVVDFADLIMHVISQFRRDVEFRDACRARWRHVMVDEFQDTNAAQFEFVQHLVGRGGPGNSTIMVVGDDCQAIHEWRGARVRNIIEFPAHFDGCVTIKLELNYRSVGNVLTAANNVIANNVVRTDKQLVCTKDAGAPLQLCEYKSEHDEARGVVKRIGAMAKRGEIARWSDVAVLYRINATSRNFEDKLREKGIPYRIVGSQSFFDRAEVKDVIAYLRLAAQPWMDMDFRRVVNVPPRGFGAASLAKLAAAAEARGWSLFQTAAKLHPLLFPCKAGDGLRAFLRAFGVDPEREALSPDTMAFSPVAHATGPALTDAALALINASGYIRHLAASPEDEQERHENVKELLGLVKKFEDERVAEGADADTEGAPRGGATLADFLSTLMLDQSTARDAVAAGAGVSDEDNEDAKNRVTLMTAHASKGLEFEAVFGVGLCDALMPFEKAVAEGRIEEERRLMYVLITRAKRHLVLSYSKKRYTYRGNVAQEPSRFFAEMQPVPCVVPKGLAGLVE